MRRPKGIARLSVFALLGVGTIAGIVLLCSIFVEQVYVRRGLREVRAQVDPVSFRLVESASAMSVNRDDLFLFALDDQDIRAARRYFSPCCFGVYTLEEFSVGTNRIFLTLGKSCKRPKIANALNDIARLRNNKIYVVGCASDETKCMVCEEWKGSWEKMRFNGSKLDCSVVDSLFYISPLVCHPLLGRLAGKFGTVKSRRASWYYDGGTPFVDTFPMVPIEDLAVSEVCDTAEQFETRHGALIAITNRRDLCERNMTRLVGCLAETNDLLSAEQIVALKIGIVDLLQRQKPMPETIVDALIDVVFFEMQPPEILDRCIRCLGAKLDEVKEEAVWRRMRRTLLGAAHELNKEYAGTALLSLAEDKRATPEQDSELRAVALDLCRDSANIRSRSAAIKLAGQRGYAEALPIMRETLSGQLRDPDCDIACIVSLGLLGCVDDIPLLSRFASDHCRASAVKMAVHRIRGREDAH